MVSAILDTVGALVTVLDSEGRIVRFNRACELTTGYALEEVQRRRIWDFFLQPEEVERLDRYFAHLNGDLLPQDYQESLGHAAWHASADRLVMLHAAGAAMEHPITSSPPESTLPSESNWRERCSTSAGGNSGASVRTCMTGSASTSPESPLWPRCTKPSSLRKQMPDAADAAKIVKLVNEAIHKTRELARGLLPVVSDAQGLMSALQLWAAEVEDLFGISCRFECETAVLIHDDAMATHLYHIAQEAVNNAIKHGHARNILIRLSAENGWGTLLISDDGTGIPDDRSTNHGMGLHIMSYRAGMIGGRLEVRPESSPRDVCELHVPLGFSTLGGKGL